jgi:hypothetical protein
LVPRGALSHGRIEEEEQEEPSGPIEKPLKHIFEHVKRMRNYGVGLPLKARSGGAPQLARQNRAQK